MKKEDLINLLNEKGFSKKIVDAFSSVPRENFAPYRFRGNAYDDSALPIGKGQTISQPSTIAVMLGMLELQRGQKVLEIGSGSGYVLALISELVGKGGRVYGVEIIEDFVKKAQGPLEEYKNVKNYRKQKGHGLPDKAPFDRIIISAALRQIPREILNQLKDGGILVAPHGPRFEQELVVIQREGDSFITKNKVPGFVFVPYVEE